MNVIEHLLTCVTEECAEIAKEACKANRFGPKDSNPFVPNSPTNSELLVIELNHLVAVVEMLIDLRQLPPNWESPAIKMEKKKKVEEFMKYSRERGCLP